MPQTLFDIFTLTLDENTPRYVASIILIRASFYTLFRTNIMTFIIITRQVYVNAVGNTSCNVLISIIPSSRLYPIGERGIFILHSNTRSAIVKIPMGKFFF